MEIKSFILCPILLTTFLFAEPNGSYPSLPSKILSNYHPKGASKKTPESFAKSANLFLASLSTAKTSNFHPKLSPSNSELANSYLDEWVYSQVTVLWHDA